MSDHQTPPAKRRYLQGLAKTMSGNSGATQAARLLEALRFGPITTNEARRFLDIYDAPARIRDLRHKQGFEIETLWQHSVTEQGVAHRVGLYVLAANGGAQ